MSIREKFYEIFGEVRKKPEQYDSFRDKRIYIRVTDEEKEIFEKLAKHERRDVSNFVRWLALEKYLNDFIKTN